MDTSPVRFRLRLVNDEAVSRIVVLEPWTGEYRLDAHSTLDVAVEGTPATPLVIRLVDAHILVEAFDTEDALLTAYRDGKELRSEHAPPAV